MSAATNTNDRLGYAEIKRVLVDDLGFRDLDAYKKWAKETRPTYVPTREALDRLAPEHVDCRDFWRVSEELFGMDGVCNLVVSPAVGVLPYAVDSHMDANRTNLRLAKSLGVTAFLDENADGRHKTLEIGPGYGGSKNYVETRTRHHYVGYDVLPRVPGVCRRRPRARSRARWSNAKRARSPTSSRRTSSNISPTASDRPTTTT
jgi:hypothetical protein